MLGGGCIVIALFFLRCLGTLGHFHNYLVARYYNLDGEDGGFPITIGFSLWSLVLFFAVGATSGVPCEKLLSLPGL